MASAHPHLEILVNMDNIVNISTNTPMRCNYPGHFLFSSSVATEGIEEDLNRRQQRKRRFEGTGFERPKVRSEVVISALLQPLGSKRRSDRSRQRGFEQKLAKEAKFWGSDFARPKFAPNS